MRRWWLGLTFVIIGLLPYISQALAQSTFEASPFVYRLKIGGCSHEPTERRQTGFRIEGKIGIVTALHGVADCEVINAVPDGADPPFNNLRIVEVDIDRDMALLSSEELAALPTSGLEESDSQQTQSNGLRLLGYPITLSHQQPTDSILINWSAKLVTLVPDEYIPAVEERNSPNPQIRVLRVEGHLLPGHSGAPVLNGDSQVIGVGNGGLESGTVEIGWLIPWQDVKWKSTSEIDVITRLQELQAIDPGLALAFSSTYPAIPPTTSSRYEGQVIDTNTSRPVEGADITFTFNNKRYVDYTDERGFFSFAFEPSKGTRGRILIEASGYDKADRYVDVLPNNTLPERFELDPVLIEPPTIPIPTWTPTSPPAPSLTPTETPNSDQFFEQEPNNSSSEADATDELRSGVVYYGYPDDRWDFFRFRTEIGGQISVRLDDHLDQGVELVLYYLSTNTRVEDDPDEPYSITRNRNEVGWYYIGILTKSGYESVVPYRLQVNYPVATPTATETATSTAIPTVTSTDTSTPTPLPTDTPTATPTATETATLTVAPTGTPTPTAQPTATPTETSTHSVTPTETPTIRPTDTPTSTSTPLPPVHYKLFVIVEDKIYEVLPIDPVTLAAEPIKLEAKGGILWRIEVILEDEHGKISPGLATYDWRFNPPDLENASRVGTGNNVLNYTVPADRKYRSIIVRVDTADFHRDINIQITIN